MRARCWSRRLSETRARIRRPLPAATRMAAAASALSMLTPVLAPCVQLGAHGRSDACRLLRPRHADERAGPQPLHRGLARFRRRGASAAGDPGRLGPLVHQRHRGHGDGRSRARSTTSTASPTSCSRSSTRRRVIRRWPRRSPSVRQADLGRPRRGQLGHRSRHLVGARARLPRGGHPRHPAVDQRHASRSRTTSTWVPAGAAARAAAC